MKILIALSILFYMPINAFARGNPTNDIIGGVRQDKDPNKVRDPSNSRGDQAIATQYLQELYGTKTFNKKNSKSNPGTK